MRDLIRTRHDVRQLQRQLKRLGFYAAKIDGLRGNLTNRAIIEFKRSVGFYPRSYVGPLTQAALISGSKASSAYPWLDEAQLILGLHEARDVSQLRAWFDKSVSWIDPRDVPWCGAFVATSLRKWQPKIELPNNPLGARNWSRFGKPCKPQKGAILTFWRGSRSGWKGHVGFCVGESSSAFQVLGGNQRNAVTDNTWIAKERLLQARWPNDHPIPNESFEIARNDHVLSVNEA